MTRLYVVLGAILLVVMLIAIILRPPSLRLPEQFPVPTPDSSAQARDAARYAAVPSDGAGFIGARIGAQENQISSTEPIRFDHAKYDTAGFWNTDEPTRLTLPRDGFYRITAQITILGAGYPDSVASPTAAVIVTRNGDASDYVCAESLTDEDPLPALLLGCSTTDWFLTGDYVELSVTPNRTVESNWPGRGNISPILSAELVNAER